MRTLDEIGLSTDTDKSSAIHNYCVKYEKYLPFSRTEKIRLLEIGVLRGSSINMWAEYYANAVCVVGIDITPDCKRYENSTKNIFIEIGSQIDKEFLNNVVKKHGPFDLIIDDGSHMQDHVVFSFDVLFPTLKSQGVYIIEDTCCAYWPEYCERKDTNNTAITYMKNLIDHVHFFGQKLSSFHSHARREDLQIAQTIKSKANIRTDIESINFMNSTVLITKR